VLRWYEPLVVPGLLQTEEYARAIPSARPDGNLDDLEEQVAARLARQAILDRTGAPQLWCILDEGVLHRAIGGSKVMRSQLYRLAEVAEHPKTTIQVIRSAGAHAGLLGGFIIADLDSKPAVRDDLSVRVLRSNVLQPLLGGESGMLARGGTICGPAPSCVILRFPASWPRASSGSAVVIMLLVVSVRRVPEMESGIRA